MPRLSRRESSANGSDALIQRVEREVCASWQGNGACAVAARPRRRDRRPRRELRRHPARLRHRRQRRTRRRGGDSVATIRLLLDAGASRAGETVGITVTLTRPAKGARPACRRPSAKPSALPTRRSSRSGLLDVVPEGLSRQVPGGRKRVLLPRKAIEVTGPVPQSQKGGRSSLTETRFAVVRKVSLRLTS